VARSAMPCTSQCMRRLLPAHAALSWDAGTCHYGLILTLVTQKDSVLSSRAAAEALADGILSSAEIATSANATVLANALRDSTCRRLGLSDTQCAHLVEIDGLATAAGKGGTSTVEPTYSIKDRVLINVEYERVNPSA
jgi:hypothetical protein